MEAEASCGGLCLVWKEDVNVSLRSFSRNHIMFWLTMKVIVKSEDLLAFMVRLMKET